MMRESVLKKCLDFVPTMVWISGLYSTLFIMTYHIPHKWLLMQLQVEI